MKIFLKSVKIIDPGSPYHQQTMDILINKGKIEEIGKSVKVVKADRTIALENLHVSPGWFDSSVSFGEPGYEERETIFNGLKTAALSGFTGIILNSGTNPVIDSNGAVTSVLSKAQKSATQLFPSGTLSKQSKGTELAEIYDMQQAGAVAFGDYKKPVSDANLLKIALQYTQNFEAIVQSYPQDENIAGKGLVNEEKTSTHLGLRGIPALAEELRISRDLSILEYTGGKLHIPTISTEGAVKLIRAAKNKGLDVTCSVAIHNLLFTDELLEDFDTNLKVLPPLRTERDNRALIEALKDGIIDMVTCDHNPVDIEHKKVEFEQALFGTIGLESAFGALLKIFSLEETIGFLINGRKRFGIDQPQIKTGAKAEISLFDPSIGYTFTLNNILSTSKNSIFLNADLTGKALGIITGEHCLISE